MLDCMGTCRSTDKKPCGNNSISAPSQKLDNLVCDFGGDAALKLNQVDAKALKNAGKIAKAAESAAKALPKIQLDPIVLGM